MWRSSMRRSRSSCKAASSTAASNVHAGRNRRRGGRRTSAVVPPRGPSKVQAIESVGWKVAIVWEHEDPATLADRLGVGNEAAESAAIIGRRRCLIASAVAG